MEVAAEGEGFDEGRAGLSPIGPRPVWSDIDVRSAWVRGWRRGLEALGRAELGEGLRLVQVAVAWALADAEGRCRGWGSSPRAAIAAQAGALPCHDPGRWWSVLPDVARYAYASEAFPARVLDWRGLVGRSWGALSPQDRAGILAAARDLDKDAGTRFAPST